MRGQAIALAAVLSCAVVGASGQTTISRTYLQIEQAYYLKLKADEIFIRRPVSDANDSTLDCSGFDTQFRKLAASCAAIELRFAVNPKSPEAYRRQAMQGYLEAARQLARAGGRAGGDLAQRHLLLVKDITFRASLLELDQDFWGSAAFDEPGIPAIQIEEMRAALVALEQLASEINVLQDRSEDKSFQQLQSGAAAVGAAADVRAALPQTDKLANARRDAQQRVATATEQLQLAIARQQEVEAKQANLSAQAQQVSNGLARQLTTAAASYFGVPEDVTRFANGKSLQDNLKAAVSQHAEQLFADPDLLASYGEIGQAAASLGRKVDEIRERYGAEIATARQAEQYFKNAKEVAEDVQSALRSPTAENLIRIGAKTLDRFDDTLKTDLTKKACSLVAQTKPVRALVEQARRPGATSDRLRVEVAKRLPDFGADELAKQLRSFAAQLDVTQKAAWLAATLRRISGVVGEAEVVNEADTKVRSELARTVLRFWPRSVVALLPPSKRDELFAEARKRFGVGTEAEILDNLRTQPVFRLDVTGNQAVLTVADRSFRLAPLEAILQVAERADGLQIEVAKVDTEIEAAIDRIQKGPETIRNELLKMVPFGAIEKAVQDLGNETQAATKLWDAAVGAIDGGIGCGDAKSVTAPLAQMQVGSLMVSEITAARQSAVRYPPDAGGPPVPEPPRPSAGKGDAETELVRQGLAAAFPGYGQAINLAIDLVKGFQKVGSLARQINDLAAEATRLVQRDIELRATIDASNMALELGLLEGELVQVRQTAAKQQFSLLTRATQAAGAQQQRGLQRIENRLPLFFYLAEALRAKYDILDRSIALWGPSGGTVRDVIRQLAMDDPQNIRLALDNDIQLFAWTNRDEERNRTDVDRVLAHWRQLYQLVSDVCARIGCVPGRVRIGHVQQTGLVDVCSLMTQQDCSALRRWLSYPAGTFTADLTIPVEGFLPDYALNVRVVDARLGGYDKEGQPVELRTAILSHPGVAFIKTESGIVRETFAPAVHASMGWPHSWNLETVASRWNSAARPERLPLEGYGLQAVWRLVLSPSGEIASLDRDAGPSKGKPDKDRRSSLVLRFVYQHQLRSNSAETAVSASAEAGSVRCRSEVAAPKPAIPGFAPFVVSPAMAALARTQMSAIGRPATAADLNADCPDTKVEPGKSASERIVRVRVPTPETDARARKDALDLLASCAGRPRDLPKGVRFEHLVRSTYGGQYDMLLAALQPKSDTAADADMICTAIRAQARERSWWSR